MTAAEFWSALQQWWALDESMRFHGYLWFAFFLLVVQGRIYGQLDED
jgi:hypothetical protein